MIVSRTELEKQRWSPCVNVSGEDIPPYAPMIVTDTADDGNLEVDQPDTDNATCDVVFNGPATLFADGRGQCTRDFPTRARRDGSFTSGSCGVKANEWKLFDTMSGFLAEGAEDTDTSSIMVTKCL